MTKHKFVEYNQNTIIIYFYKSNEGHRAHVHVRHKDGTEAKVWLDDLTLKQASGDSQFDKLAMKLAKRHQQEGLDNWELIHGNKDE